MPTVPSEKIHVVYPPCDVDSLSVTGGRPISRYQRPANKRYVFLSMNRFWPEKRLDILVDAAGELFLYFKLIFRVFNCQRHCSLCRFAMSQDQIIIQI